MFGEVLSYVERIVNLFCGFGGVLCIFVKCGCWIGSGWWRFVVVIVKVWSELCVFVYVVGRGVFGL